MTPSPIRVVFLGTPEFAVPSLAALVTHHRFDVVGVVTQPDRPAGRGRQIAKSAVKLAAEKHDIPVFQPETLRDEAAVLHLHEMSPDVLVVAAFGQILRKSVLELPPYGCVNVHASLLPRWRGAAPIQYAIREGDSETGITIMKMDIGLDSGPIIEQHPIPIEDIETGRSLHDKLADLGAQALPDALLRYIEGGVMLQPQPEQGITLAPILKKMDGLINWEHPAIVIDRQVRAYTPWPGAFTGLNGQLLKVISGAPLPSAIGAPVGALVAHGNHLCAQTGDGLYRLDEVQLAGKQRISGPDFQRGHTDALGMILSNPEQA